MKKGFTLIEILITLSIIGLLTTISAFAISGARVSARDAKRKADLQNIRTAFELFYSDCGHYPLPTSSRKVPVDIIGDNSTNCPSTNIYLTDVPIEPIGNNVSYAYARPTTSSFVLCTHIEGDTTTTTALTECSNNNLDCSSGVCNYSVSGP